MQSSRYDCLEKLELRVPAMDDVDPKSVDKEDPELESVELDKVREASCAGLGVWTPRSPLIL
jgi:hypothetical protein